MESFPTGFNIYAPTDDMVYRRGVQTAAKELRFEVYTLIMARGTPCELKKNPVCARVRDAFELITQELKESGFSKSYLFRKRDSDAGAVTLRIARGPGDTFPRYEDYLAVASGQPKLCE
jgi:hypothetical protein